MCRKPKLKFVLICWNDQATVLGVVRTGFLQDYCSPSQVESARRAQKQWNEGHDAPSASTSPAANG